MAKRYVAQGFDFCIDTTSRNLVLALLRRPQWQLVRANIVHGRRDVEHAVVRMNITHRPVKTYAFFYRRMQK